VVLDTVDCDELVTACTSIGPGFHASWRGVVLDTVDCDELVTACTSIEPGFHAS
jgi:hypothetical protein